MLEQVQPGAAKRTGLAHRLLSFSALLSLSFLFFLLGPEDLQRSAPVFTCLFEVVPAYPSGPFMMPANRLLEHCLVLVPNDCRNFRKKKSTAGRSSVLLLSFMAKTIVYGTTDNFKPQVTDKLQCGHSPKAHET